MSDPKSPQGAEPPRKDRELAAAVDAVLSGLDTAALRAAWATACSPSQWNRLRPIVQANTTPAIWDELTSSFGLNGDGPIV